MKTVLVDEAEQVRAPDGSLVYLLTSVGGAGTAVFELQAGQVARPVRHPRVEECWYVLSGHGRIWRQPVAGAAEVTHLVPGVSLDIPRGTSFQFRADGELLRILGVTSPPWDGPADAEVLDEGVWPVHL